MCPSIGLQHRPRNLYFEQRQYRPRLPWWARYNWINSGVAIAGGCRLGVGCFFGVNSSPHRACESGRAISSPRIRSSTSITGRRSGLLVGTRTAFQTEKPILPWVQPVGRLVVRSIPWHLCCPNPCPPARFPPRRSARHFCACEAYGPTNRDSLRASRDDPTGGSPTGVRWSNRHGRRMELLARSHRRDTANTIEFVA